MRQGLKSIAMSIALLPLLLGVSHAAQSWAVDPPEHPWIFSSEESGTGAYLGVDVSDVTTERMSALKLKEEKGVEVTMVDQDAPAGKAGIREHDVILSMNGTTIESGAQLRRMIRETPPGRIVSLDLSRDGQPMTVKVQLGDKNKEFSMTVPKGKSYSYSYTVPQINIPDIEIPEITVNVVRSSARSGLMVENLTPQLGEYFGVKDGNGVLVRSVEKGSRAEKAGLRAGDVIVRVNKEAVHDTGDFTRALRSCGGGSNSVSVIREKKELNLNLTLPDRKSSDEGSELLEESLEDRDRDVAEYDSGLSRLEGEIARLQPQLNLLTSDQLQKAGEALRKAQCIQQRQLRKQVEQLQQLRPELQEEIRREQEKLRDQMRRWQHEMQGDWLDI
jgi:membrane-associated protease RseP (regulator of RpoE activity)